MQEIFHYKGSNYLRQICILLRYNGATRDQTGLRMFVLIIKAYPVTKLFAVRVISKLIHLNLDTQKNMRE